MESSSPLIALQSNMDDYFLASDGGQGAPIKMCRRWQLEMARHFIPNREKKKNRGKKGLRGSFIGAVLKPLHVRT